VIKIKYLRKSEKKELINKSPTCIHIDKRLSSSK